MFIVALSFILITGSYAVDKDEIAALIERHYEALMEGDVDTYMSNFSDDADWENALGNKITDITELNEWMTRVAASLAEASFTIDSIMVRSVTPEVAVADLYGLVKNQFFRGRTLPPRYLMNTFILRKENGRWLIVVERIRDRLELDE